VFSMVEFQSFSGYERLKSILGIWQIRQLMFHNSPP
jgi:hypothetical protein